MAVQVSVKIKEWLGRAEDRWNQGLLEAGNAWKSENSKYPGGQSPFYIRKGGLRDKSNFDIIEPGKEMALKGVSYWKYLMFGTGVHGPRGAPFGPVHAKFLRWRSEQGGLYSKNRSEGYVYARTSSGTIWSGKLDSIIEAMKRAFRLGIRRNPD